MDDKELQIQEKQDVQTSAESASGGPMFIPNADIYEDSDAINVLVDMPGVEKGAVTINLEDNNLSLYGRVSRPEFESKAVYSEYRTGDFSRSFVLPDVIDQTKIDANMKNGVLHLRLPKAEHAKPRKIEIKAA